MASNYVSLLREAITRLEGQEPQVYSEQCKAMVREFVHVRDSLSSLLLRGEFSSAPIFQELHRLACEAERVLTGFCDQQQWIQAVVVTDAVFTDPKWSIFKTLGSELNWCFNILLENDSTVERLTDRNTKDIRALDHENLIAQLEGAKRGSTGDPQIIAKFVLARLDKTGDALISCWSTKQLNCGVMKRFLSRHLNVTVPEYIAVDFDVFMIESRNVEGDRTVIESGDLKHSIVTQNLKWAGVSVAGKGFLRLLKKDPGYRVIRKEWSKEVCIMANLNHPNVARFIGCSSQGDDHGPAILMESEDMSLQKLIELLQTEENNKRMLQAPAVGRRRGEPLLDTLVAVDILTQIASGMAYLHGQDVAHLDLKLANLLVSSSKKLPEFLVRNRDYFFRVKIADFGNSIHLKGFAAGKIRNPFGSINGTTSYRAPELFKLGGMVCMKSADTCSFAFTCWAILHCEDPKLQDGQGSEYYDALVRGTRLGFHETIPGELRDLISRCWDTNPDARPGFSEIFHVLQSYKGKLLGSQLPLVQFQNRPRRSLTLRQKLKRFLSRQESCHLRKS